MAELRDVATGAGLSAVVTVANVNQFLAILNYDLSVAHYEVASRSDG